MPPGRPGPTAAEPASRTTALLFAFPVAIICALTLHARLALYRVTQEALTNVVKHADAERVEVCLAYAADRVSLTIEDVATCRSPAAGKGICHPPAAGTDGYGLTGMRERAELLGGTLTASATPAGFRVELQVPA